MGGPGRGIKGPCRIGLNAGFRCFEEGTFELSEIWDETGIVLDETIKQYPAKSPQAAGIVD